MTREEQVKFAEYGERITRLELTLDHMAKSLDEVRANQKELASQIRALNDLLNQAKGAKWAMASLIALSAMIGGLVAKFMPLFTMR